MSPDRTQTIYKIVDAVLWREAEATGAFHGAGIDLTDGYIHLSTAAQARATAAKHYAGRENLLLVAVDGAGLGDALRYEPSREGDLFPHLYGPLTVAHVAWTCPLPLGADGAHAFPAGMDG